MSTALPNSAFVDRLPCGKEEPCQVVVEPMRDEHVHCWQAIVQPEIDASPGPRADKGWRWAHIFGASRLSSTPPTSVWGKVRGFAGNLWGRARSQTAWAGWIGQQPSAFALCLPRVSVGEWKFLPCVIAALVERYKALDDKRQIAHANLDHLRPEGAPLVGGS